MPEKIECPHANGWDRKCYRNGVAFCVDCNVVRFDLEPLERCYVCDIPTFYTRDCDGRWYCKEHFEELPEEKWTERHHRQRKQEEDYQRWCEWYDQATHEERKERVQSFLADPFGRNTAEGSDAS